MKIVLMFFILFHTLFASDKLDLRTDKIYVLDFFASWCSSCEKEIPILSLMVPDLQKEGIEVIGIDVDKNREDGKKFQSKMAQYINFKIVDDSTNEIINNYKPLGMPALYVIKDRTVCGKIFGAIPNLKEKLNQKIKQCKGES